MSRFCMNDKPDIADCYSEDNVHRRTNNNRAYHVSAIKENAVNKNKYGVHKQCGFNSLISYFFTAFPRDIMHDM